MVNRIRFGKLFVGTVAAVGGAILGGFLATMVLLALGAILGAVSGWFFVRAFMALRHGILKRFLGGFFGVVLGMFVGAIIWAVRLNQTTALIGVAWGFGIGAVIGPLLFLLFIGALRSLLHTHGNDRGNVVDTTFQR